MILALMLNCLHCFSAGLVHELQREMERVSGQDRDGRNQLRAECNRERQDRVCLQGLVNGLTREVQHLRVRRPTLPDSHPLPVSPTFLPQINLF